MSDYANSYGKSSHNILLTGNTGTGKTKLACLIANEIIKHRFNLRMSIAFKRAGQIRDEVRATWSNYSKQTEADYIEHLSGVSLLIIDEVGEADISIVKPATSGEAHSYRMNEFKKAINKAKIDVVENYSADVKSVFARGCC